MTYELWVDKEGTYSFFPSSNKHTYDLIENDAQLVYMFSANTWEQAMQMYYDYMSKPIRK